ncbi:hypothetical protein ACJJTC_002970 [Scirpophaga incertulas]
MFKKAMTGSRVRSKHTESSSALAELDEPAIDAEHTQAEHGRESNPARRAGPGARRVHYHSASRFHKSRVQDYIGHEFHHVLVLAPLYTVRDQAQYTYPQSEPAVQACDPSECDRGKKKNA